MLVVGHAEWHVTRHGRVAASRVGSATDRDSLSTRYADGSAGLFWRMFWHHTSSVKSFSIPLREYVSPQPSSVTSAPASGISGPPTAFFNMNLPPPSWQLLPLRSGSRCSRRSPVLGLVCVHCVCCMSRVCAVCVHCAHEAEKNRRKKPAAAQCSVSYT